MTKFDYLNERLEKYNERIEYLKTKLIKDINNNNFSFEHLIKELLEVNAKKDELYFLLGVVKQDLK